MTSLNHEDPGVRQNESEAQVRTFLCVPNFDQIQNPRRPDRPTWLKLYVRDLQDPDWVTLTLTVRGFATDFQKLAASMKNRVPYDVRFIARMVGAPPAVVGKMLSICLKHELIARFAEDLKTSKINDIKQKIGSLPIPTSLSNSESNSNSKSSTKVERSVPSPIDHCSGCNDPNCLGCSHDSLPWD